MACKNDSDWNTILEPQSESNLDARPLYPYNNISYTESGHLFEMDNTLAENESDYSIVLIPLLKCTLMVQKYIKYGGMDMKLYYAIKRY